MFDVVYQEGNARCVKGSHLDGPTWLRRTQSAHCGWQSTVSLWGSDLWWLRDRLMQAPCTGWCPVGRWHRRPIVPSAFLFPVPVPRTFGSGQTDTHQHWLHPSMIVTPQEMWIQTSLKISLWSFGQFNSLEKWLRSATYQTFPQWELNSTITRLQVTFKTFKTCSRS